MAEPLENLSLEEAMGIMRERVGADGTVALVTLLRHSQEEVLRTMDARFDRLEERLERRFEAIDRRFEAVEARFDQLNARIDGTLRYAITFSLSLLGLVAAVATGLLALNR